jgi:PhoH-like ATPase
LVDPRLEGVDDKVGYLFEKGWIEVEAVTYIRGRSLPKLFIIIDEAQNLTPHEIKTIVSRAGRESKVVLTGDPYQIDNPYLDASSNGLSTLVDRFKQQPIFGHVTLERSERSELASLAAELL